MKQIVLIAALVVAVLILGTVILVDRTRFEPKNIKPLQRTMLDAKYPVLRHGLVAICDPKNGNLIYLHREGRENSMAVVPGGCKDVLMNLEKEQ